MKKVNNYFHINYPFWSAWQKYGWEKDIWGLGLEKNRIDKLAETNEMVVVSYYKSDKEYTIRAKKCQKYPIEKIKDYDTYVYIVPKNAMMSKPKPKSIGGMTMEELFKQGILS